MAAPVIETFKSSNVVRRLVPRWVKAAIRGRRRIEIVPLDEAYPEHKKHYVIPSETVHTPEAAQMRAWGAATGLLNRDTFSTPDVFTTVLPDALYCPTNSALLTSSRGVVAESIGVSGIHYPFEGEALSVDEVRPLSGYCTPLRYFMTNYYHTLVDALPRLYLLREALYSPLDDIKLLHTGALSPIEQLFIEKMCPDNVRPVEVQEGRLYEVENYIFISFLSRQSAGYLPAPYLHAFRSKMLPERPPRGDKRIFISRQHAHKRRIINYEEVEACVRHFGFQEYILENLSVQEQIDLFYDAEMVVGTHGAGLTNLLFAGRQACVVEIFPMPKVLVHYYYLCKCLGHRYTYLCGETPELDVAEFEVDVRRLSTALKEAQASLQKHE